MIRLSSEMERGAREAHYAFGCTVYAVGDYMRWLTLGLGKKPDLCHLVLVGPEEELRTYRADALKLGAKINPDGSVVHNNTHFTFQTSLTVTPAYDIFRGHVITARTPVNETLKVYVDDKFVRNLTHFESTSEALRKRVDAELLDRGGVVTIRDTDGGPVLHQWKKEAPPVRTLKAYLNDAKNPKEVTWTNDRSVTERELGAVRGDFIRLETAPHGWYVGGVYAVGVQRGDRTTRLFFPVGEPIDFAKLAESVGAGPGDSFSWAKRADGVWTTHTLAPRDATAYTANYNGYLSTARGFLSSKTDKAKVREDALKALGYRLGDARLYIRSNTGDGAFPQHYTEC